MNIKIWIKNNNGYPISITLAIIHWILSFFTDKIIFLYPVRDLSSLTGIMKTIMTYGCKLVFLLLLIGIYNGIYLILKNIRVNAWIKTWFKFSVIYIVIMLLLLLLTWPGIWRMDEFGILKNAREFYPVFWQNYLTSIFYMLGMMLFPIPAGVIILQLMLIGGIVGIVLTMVDTTSNHSKWTYLLYIPFFLLPVLDSNLYPMRMSIYAFLELLWVASLFYYKVGKNPITKNKVLFLSLLAAVITVWRSEAIYYVIAAPIIVIVLLKNEMSKKHKWQFTLTFLLLTMFLGLPQQVGNKVTSGDQYDITAVMLPITPLINQAALNEDQQELQAIDKVLNTDIILQEYEDGKSGINIFWNHTTDLINPAYTAKEYDEFKNAYYTLIMKYPFVFMKERMETFLDSNWLLMNTTEIYTNKESPNYSYFIESYKGNQPINNEVRTAVIRFLECKSQQDYNINNTSYNWTYNFLPPLIFLFLLFVLLLIRKKWGYALVIGGVGAKVPLIFLTAPSRLFMYYYSIYVIGYAVFFFLLLDFLLKTDLGKRLTGNNIRKGIVFFKKNGLSEASVKVRERLYRDKQERNYQDWLQKHLPTREELLIQKNLKFSYSPLISILVPTYQTKKIFLIQLLESICNQSYANWELCIADGSYDDTVENIVKEYKQDKRIRYQKLTENKGISENTNEALQMAKGEYIGLLDHDDLLTKDALYEMVKAIQKNAYPDLLYSDEDKVTFDLNRHFSPHFKSDFNLDLLRSNNYICHFLVVKKELAISVGGFDSNYNGAQDYDFVLKCCEKAKGIIHVPRILYHWRAYLESTSENPESKLYAYEAGKKALQAHLKRMGLEAMVLDTVNYGYYYIKYKVLNDLDTNSKQLCNKIIQVWDMKQPVNQDVKYLLLMSEDIEITSDGFLEEMVSLCQREDVAVVGGSIVNAHGKVMFGGGIFKNDEEILGYPFQGLPVGFKGYMNRLTQVQNCSFVSSYFCLIKKEAFDMVNGFSKQLTGDYAILDLCFKLKEIGYLTVYTPYAKAILKRDAITHIPQDISSQRECMMTKWKKHIEGTDGFYNINFSQEEGKYYMFEVVK